MQSLAIVILIIGAIVFFSFFTGNTTEKEEALPQTQETIPQTQISRPAENLLSLESPETTALINTYITSAPKEGAIIEDTNEITFEFKAKALAEIEGRITFETKVEGLEDDWEETSREKRTVTFPSGSKEYTFLVRAKVNNQVDPTPAKRTFKINISPYFEKIKISSAKAKTSSRSSLITLRANLEEDEEINITGWQIIGKRGASTIPKGIEKYPPYSSAANDNIIIRENDRVYLSGAQNPLGRNQNFRVNKCLGYLENYHYFPISLSTDCPQPSDAEIAHLEPCCQEFIEDLKRCEVPDYSQNKSIRGDSECTSYLTEYFNYGACFSKFQRDEDFLENEWHIYMDRSNLPTEECDILYLKDGGGLVVDKYNYGRLICD